MHHNHIMVARNTAEKEAKVHLAKAAKAAKVEQAAKKKKGFFSWGGRDDALPGTMSAEADIVLDEAELAALDAVHPDFAVKYDDDEQALLSKNLWELNLSCSINITLSRKCGQKRVLEMVLPSTTAKIERREFDGSYVATMAMHSLRLVDPQRQETQVHSCPVCVCRPSRCMSLSSHLFCGSIHVSSSRWEQLVAQIGLLISNLS